MRSKKLKVPNNVYITLTSKCNLNCIHCFGCYGQNNTASELSGDEWCNIIEDLSRNKVFYVNISGGEPTVHRDFKQIVNSLVVNKMHFILTTNGLCGDDILDCLLPAKDLCLGIKISLDGYDADSHTFIRRDKNNNQSNWVFERTIKAIKFFQSKGFNCTIATCLHIMNIHDFDKMIVLIKELHPNNWYISTISNIGRAFDNNEIFVSESLLPLSYWYNLKSICENSGIAVRFVDMPNLVKSNENRNVYFQCPAARSFCEIYADGLTSPCPLARIKVPTDILSFDNIKEVSINKIWDGKSFTIFRQWQHSGCDGCIASGKCERCVPQSIQWSKDPMKPPPYCVANGENLKLKNVEELRRELMISLQKSNRNNYIKEI